nr:hypothetical protein [Deinococcus alpinitundrae]
MTGARRLIHTDDHTPQSILIPTQGLAAKGQRQHQKQQQHPAEPLHFARVLVGSHQVNAGHVNARHHDHQGHTEVVQPAHDGLEAARPGDLLKALIGGGGRRLEEHRQRDAAHHL